MQTLTGKVLAAYVVVCVAVGVTVVTGSDTELVVEVSELRVVFVCRSC